MRGLKTIYLPLTFLRKLLEDVLHQKGKLRRMQKMEGATQDSRKGLMVAGFPGCSQSLLIYLRWEVIRSEGFRKDFLRGD